MELHHFQYIENIRMLNENIFIDFVKYTFCVKLSIDSIVLSFVLVSLFVCGRG
jgi:hypothetical protein